MWGEDFADILVEDVLVVELKCVDSLATEHIGIPRSWQVETPAGHYTGSTTHCWLENACAGHKNMA